MSADPHAHHDLWYVAEKAVVCGRVDSGPGLVQTPQGDLLAFFGTPHGTEQHRATAAEVAALVRGRVQVSRSTDGGLTWSPPVDLPAPEGLDVHYGMPSCALCLPSGRILLVVRWHAHGAELQWIGGVLTLGYQGALSQEESDARTYSALIYRSRDEGLTWGDPTVLVRPGAHCRLAAEPSLAALPDGRWVALVRYHPPGNSAATVRLESRDEGRTWSAPAHLFVGAMDCLRNLPGGGLVVSHVSTAGIVVRFSYDGGWTWTREVWAFDIWAEGQYRNGACWNQSLLVVDEDMILCGFTSVAPDDAHKDVRYGARQAEWGLAARVRFLRRQRDGSLTVPREVAG
ncbi:MAG: sialidase family protein [Candidatus Latescibacterota bacterium]